MRTLAIALVVLTCVVGVVLGHLASVVTTKINVSMTQTLKDLH